MRRQPLLCQLAAASIWLLVFGAAAQSAEVHLANDSLLDAASSPPPHRVPVLFVHGHNETNQDTDFNYRKNWQAQLRGLPSFKQTLELAENNGLGIEAYYIRFQNQDRSITEDAAEISDAIDRILHRHDPAFDYPYNATQTTHVKVAVIAYSKGTISTRQYLKGLQTTRPGFRPVSEFIAIAPPNHAISTRVFALTQSLAVKQLYNGYRPEGAVFDCGDSFNEPRATDYISSLNNPDEAPGSRGPNDLPASGTLYLTMFDALDRDMVGGDAQSTDCIGRAVAVNQAPNAVNLPISGIVDNGWQTISSLFTDAERQAIAVHQNTVHTPEVICQALYAAVHHRSPSNQTCSSVDVAGVPVPVIPPPPRAAAILTLDFSGSMAAPAPPDPSRAAVLKDAVELFVRLWSTVSVPSDRIGLIHFDTNVTRVAINNEALPLLSGAADAVIAEVNAQNPGSATAMGNSLQQAIQTLSDPSVNAAHRRVILFTDGMQNVNPMARIVNDQLTFVNEPGRPSSNVAPGAPAFLDPSLGIAVDTIGIGAGEAFVGLLQDISRTTRGRFLGTTEPAELRRFFVEELINALKGFSPQLVAYRRGRIGSAGNKIESFAVEAGPRRVVLKVSWKRGDAVDHLSVRKDGVDVTAAGRLIDGAFYKIFVIDLPAKGRSPITARGNWQLRIKAKATTAYETAAIVDGGSITYDAAFNAKRLRVGNPLDLVVRSTAGGKPIGARARVTASLLMPTAAVSDIIAAKPAKEPPVFEPGMTVPERQLLALPQEPKEWAKLRQRRETVVLKRSGKDAFSTRLRPQVPGVYTAVVTIDGDTATIGKFSRTVTATAVVSAQEPGTPGK